MANSNPPKKNQAFTFFLTLAKADGSGDIQNSPTIAAGDFKVLFGSTLQNLTTLPAINATDTRVVDVTLSATEMNVDQVIIRWIDQTTPKEWVDGSLSINTTA